MDEGRNVVGAGVAGFGNAAGASGGVAGASVEVGNRGFSEPLTTQGGGLNSNSQGFAQGAIASGGAGLGAAPAVNQAPVISSSRGDVVLSSGGVKKRRWPIIAAAVLCLVAVVAGVGAVVALNSGGAGSIDVAANKYSNYLVSGKELTSKLVGEYDVNEFYEILLKLDDYKNSRDYFNKLNNLYQDFEKKYNAMLGGGDAEEVEEKYDAFVVGQKERLQFITSYVEIGKLDEKELIAELVNQGASGLKRYATEYYSQYLSGGIALDEQYYNAQTAYIEDWVTVYSYYLNSGCISKETAQFSIRCAEGLALPEDILTRRADLSQKEALTVTLVYSTARAMARSAFENSGGNA